MVCPFKALWTELIVAISDRISQTNAAVNDELYVQSHAEYSEWKQYKHTLTSLTSHEKPRTHTHALTHTHTHTHEGKLIRLLSFRPIK